jgi:FHA domain-containing protein/zinc ribbon family protein
VLTDNPPELHEAGERVGQLGAVGSLTCVECGYALSLGAMQDDLPRCPACGGASFKRSPLFEQPTLDAAAVTPPADAPSWLSAARAEITEPRPHIAFEWEGDPVVVPLARGWTRIGRSGSADICLDDPTVSRRHALVVRTPEGELRALDDRSLNGLFVNGERVEWAPLSDGDELEIGRYRLFVLEP